MHVNFDKMLETFSTVSCTVIILNIHPINRSSKAGATLVNTIGEGGGTEFFYQSATRYLSSECSDFPHLACHVET